MASAKNYNMTVRIPIELKDEFQKVLELKGNLQQSYEIRNLMKKFIADYYKSTKGKKHEHIKS